MAFKKALAQRLFNVYKISTQALTSCRIASTSWRPQCPPDPNKMNKASDPGDNGVFRRLLHGSTIVRPDMSLTTGESIRERIRSVGIARDRIRLDCLSSQPPNSSAAMFDLKEGLSVGDVRKLLRAAQLEGVKSRLSGIQKSWIPYSEFVRICGQGCSDPDHGTEFAKLLEASGTVITIGNVVFLRPGQVAKAIGGLLPSPGPNPNDPRWRELEELEKRKAAIDKEAESLVRRELWCGLGFLVLQTAAFMRLTFWELSWDIMEPICFYVTSAYFMAGYAFFLRTNKEPSFEGFYQSRFSTKQRRLMKLRNFDIARYSDLRKACSLHSPPTNNP